eukprot:scaffold1591_cov208-Alexandrium_tamarense.AAC.15
MTAHKHHHMSNLLLLAWTTTPSLRLLLISTTPSAPAIVVAAVSAAVNDVKRGRGEKPQPQILLDDVFQLQKEAMSEAIANDAVRSVVHGGGDYSSANNNVDASVNSYTDTPPTTTTAYHSQSKQHEQEQIKEQRTHHYFHSGIQTAALNSMYMAGYDMHAIQDENNGSTVGMGDSLLQFLEGALGDELERVRARLAMLDEEVNVGGGGVVVEGGTHQSDNNETNANSTSTNTTNASESELPSPETLTRAIYTKEFTHFQCERYVNAPSDLVHPEAKWDELLKSFWRFAGVASEDDDCGNEDCWGYVPNEGVHVDYIPLDELQSTSEATVPQSAPSSTNNNTRQRGLFASRPFQKGELVYSSSKNAVYFQQLTAWSDFLHFLPRSKDGSASEDACLVMEWSFMQKIHRPGRWLVCMVLDEGVYLRQADGGTAVDSAEVSLRNVALIDDITLEYYALRDIEQGEQILE